jgi:hypothetical protein
MVNGKWQRGEVIVLEKNYATSSRIRTGSGSDRVDVGSHAPFASADPVATASGSESLSVLVHTDVSIPTEWPKV